MRERLLQVLEEGANDVSDEMGDEALGRFWSKPRSGGFSGRLPRELPASEQNVVVDLEAYKSLRSYSR